jgi:hypothetical protein
MHRQALLASGNRASDPLCSATIMPDKDRKKKTLSIRVAPETAARLQRFIADYAGKPLFLQTSSFCEAAIIAHLDRTALLVEEPQTLNCIRGEMNGLLKQR